MSTSRGDGGSPPQSGSGRHRQNETPQVALHSDGVDQLVHDANCAGQLLDAWQLDAVVAIASRIASGSLLNAAFSIPGVGGSIARLMYSGVSPVIGSAVEATASGAGLGDGSWPAAEQA